MSFCLNIIHFILAILSTPIIIISHLNPKVVCLLAVIKPSRSAYVQLCPFVVFFVRNKQYHQKISHCYIILFIKYSLLY
jgi:hypothetical protein